jgi:molybdopterin adenylyltransferase
MRVIRIVDGSNSNSVPMIYLHTGKNGGWLINGKPAEIFGSGPGEIDILSAGQWQIVFSPACPLEEGAFISTTDGGPVFRTGTREESRLELEPVKGGFLSLSQKAAVVKPIMTGILTVSDKGSRGERKDTAGPALAELVRPLGAVVCLRKIVPDDRSEIASVLSDWADREGMQLILVTGGTGLSSRDVTPEALSDISERVVPGIGEAMRRKTEPLLDRSILSRGLAVTRGNSLLIAFPGSERGARQCFDAIAPVIRHAVEILNGWEGECATHGRHAHSHG